MSRRKLRDRHPERDEIWIHVDRFDKRGRRVWALQYWYNNRACYRVARFVDIRVPMYTRYHGADVRQPRAYLVVAVSRPKCTICWQGPRVQIAWNGQ